MLMGSLQSTLPGFAMFFNPREMALTDGSWICIHTILHRFAARDWTTNSLTLDIDKQTHLDRKSYRREGEERNFENLKLE